MAYSIEIKAAAIADLLTGDQPAVVAKRYNLPGSLVRKWKFRLGTPDGTPHGTPDGTEESLCVDAVDASGASTQRKTPRAITIRPGLDAQQLELGELVMLNLRAKLIATQRIAEYVTQPQWFDKQSAADMAALFEAIDRSAIGMLDRLARRSIDDSAP